MSDNEWIGHVVVQSQSVFERGTDDIRPCFEHVGMSLAGRFLHCKINFKKGESGFGKTVEMKRGRNRRRAVEKTKPGICWHRLSQPYASGARIAKSSNPCRFCHRDTPALQAG